MGVTGAREAGTAAGGRRVAGVAHTIPFFRSCHTRLRIEPGFNPGPAWAVRRKRPPFKMSLCTRTTDQKKEFRFWMTEQA